MENLSKLGWKPKNFQEHGNLILLWPRRFVPIGALGIIAQYWSI